jgi:hypothetical protein
MHLFEKVVILSTQPLGGHGLKNFTGFSKLGLSEIGRDRHRAS